MNGSPTYQRLSQQALDEHQQIQFFLDRLDRALEALPVDLQDVEPLRRLAAQIEALRERLGEHIALEEQGGLFQGIVDALPEAGPEIHRLIREHAKMMERLGAARLHAAEGDAGAVPSLKSELREFLVQIREHERREEALLRRALDSEDPRLLT